MVGGKIIKLKENKFSSNNQLTKLSTLGTLTSLQQYLLQNNQYYGV